MQKQEKFLLEGHRSTSLCQTHKSAIWNRTPPHLHIKPSLYVCRKVQGSQIFKQNWNISIRSRVIVILPIWVSSALGGGAGGWGVSGMINYSIYEFRNVQRQRISISSGLTEFWCFGPPAALGRRQMGGGASGGMGGVPTHMHMHVHACTCTHTHLYMYRNCKWPPTWRHPCLACLTCMCVHACVCVHACACVHAWDTPPHTPIPTPPPSTHPPPPRGWTPGITWNSITLPTYQDISIPFEDLKSVKNSPSMGGCVVWWVGGWLGGLMGGVRSNH